MGRTDSKTGGKQDSRQLTRCQREQRRVSEAQETGSTPGDRRHCRVAGQGGPPRPGEGADASLQAVPKRWTRGGPSPRRARLAAIGRAPKIATRTGRHPAPASRRRTPSPAPDEVTWNMFNSGTTKWRLLFPLFTSCKLSLCHLKKITTKNIAMSLGGKI